MKKQKSNLNWYSLLGGVLILFFGLTISQPIRQSKLEKITVELTKDMTLVKGSRSPIDYKFWTKEYKNQFNILDGSITGGKHKAIADLKSGQVIDLFITTSDFENLSNDKANITVNGISLNGNPLITPEEFFHNQELYNVRIKIFFVFTALMVILNSLTKIPTKLNYIMVGTFIGIVIIMRIFDIGLF